MGNGSSDAGGSSSDHIHNVCAHNDREGVSVGDVVEHIGNFEYGSAGRDVADVASGNQDFVGWNQAPPENVSVGDVAEHVGNFELGSAVRDMVDIASGNQDLGVWKNTESSSSEK